MRLGASFENEAFVSDPRVRGRPEAVILAVLALCVPPAVRGAVVITEIHYDPPEGQVFEFVELHNAGNDPVDLSGWSLTNGVRFTIPDGRSIPAKGFLLIARNPGEIIAGSGLPPESVLGPFAGSLDDDGELLELSDAQGVIVDSVRFESEEPWDSRARGEGPSLQRLCAAAPARLFTAWTAGEEPTPLGPTGGGACPPPAPPRPTIAINEIHYHAANLNDPREEFVELRNNSASAVQLRGHRFTAGIEYRFEEDALVEPGEAVVVCRDAEQVKKTFGLTRAFGNFTGQLSNDGERITLVNGAGAVVDSVRYDDHGEWPVVPDELGASLEKIRPDAPSDDPMSWTASDTPSARNRQRVVVRGQATSVILAFQLDKTGECLIDNLSLVDVANPAQNLVPGGDFERGVGFMRFEGTHTASGLDPNGGPDGSAALRLKAALNPPWGGEKIVTQAPNRASLDLRSVIRVNDPVYELSFDFRFMTGWRGLTVSFLDSTPSRGLHWRFDARPSATPGLENTAFSGGLPPQVSEVFRTLREPGSTDAVTIRARVRAEPGPAAVTLEYRVDLAGAATTVECVDDGAHGDGEAGDGIHGATLPPRPHNTIVTFRIRAEDAAGRVTLWPPDSDPTGVAGYYVNDLRPRSPLPIPQILLQHTSRRTPRQVIAQLDCQHYWTASFAFGGDLYPGISMRMRGASVCMTAKPYLKFRFLRGRELDGQRKLNFQAMWTDKSLVRELLCWELFRDLGHPSCKAEYVRAHANGQYYGLFMALENPGPEMLERNGLDPEGNLYKSIGSNEAPFDDPRFIWEKETNENGDFSDLDDFIDGMHAAPITGLRVFFRENSYEDRIISYQLGQILANNIDYAGHNHYLYRDPTSGKWLPLEWDLDLTFGKAGVLDDYEFIPGGTPWFSTAIEGEHQSYLLDRFFSDAGSWYRRAYLISLHDALHERFTEAFYESRLQAIRELIFDEQNQDIQVWGRLTDQGGGQFPRDFLSNLDRVRFYVRERRKYLLRYLDERARFRGHDRLMITEIAYNPTDEDLEFVELWNPGDKPIDLSRWRIDGIGYVFPDGTQAGPNEVFVVARSPAAFEQHHGGAARVLGPYETPLDNGGATLDVRDRGPGHPAIIDQVRYEDDGAWPREADGTGRTLELTAASEWRDNSVPGSWRASAAAGGSPGTVEGVEPAESRFRRGDTDADGRIDLSDALVVLGYLYLGAGEPACREAGDTDSDGMIELDDPIFLLRHLFLGDQTPIPFPGPGECGPTPAESCRVSNCS
jgi:hypothetical protein